MLPKMLLTIAVGVAALTFSASSSKAVEFFFGDQALPVGCGGNTPQIGHVCGTSLTYNAFGNSLTATAWSANPGTSTAENLTVRLTSDVGGHSESGLGENQSPIQTSCTDPNCEIGGGTHGHSVLITSGVGLTLLDVLVGSAQPMEAFDLWTNSGGSLIDLGTITPTATTCPGDICTLTFASATQVAIQNNGPANILVTAVSAPAPAPEPASLALLGTALVGLGVMRRRRR